MSALIGNAVVGQSGGPTAAINATLSGVIRGAFKAHERGIINKLYGMRNGIEGLLQEHIVDLFDRFSDKNELDILEMTPAAALGSCRKKMKSPEDDPQTYARLLDIFKKYDIRYFFYIGGNDSMDTVYRLSTFAENNDYEIKVIGVPKTIDNDLMVTDHTPGFGSAAKFVATTIKEIQRDISVYSMKAVTIVEIMGRDAGWLTASSALTKLSGGMSPDLVYLPEKPFDTERFILDIQKKFEEHPALVVAVSEGIRFSDGRYVGEGTDGRAVDAFGHKALAGAGKVLEAIVKERLGCKVRSMELSLTQRCAAHCASKTDILESVMVGRGAVFAAVDGKSGVMMTINRDSNSPYSVHIGSQDISKIANEVKSVPDEFINAEANGITDLGLEYLAPLIIGELECKYENGLPKHIII